MIRNIVNKHKMKQGGTCPSEFNLRNNYFDEKDLVRYKVAYYLFLREKMLCSFYRRKSFSEKGVREFWASQLFNSF